jgi:probable HAF family extracellular repeat protein
MQRKIALSCLMLAVLGTLSCAASAAPTYTITPLGTLGSSNDDDIVKSGGLNNSGQVVGWGKASNGADMAYLASGGKTTNLNPPGALTSRATGINDASVISATVTHGNDYTDHATRIQNGVVTDLGTLGGANSEATGINNAGMIVGDSQLFQNQNQGLFHGFMTQGNKLVDIGTLIGPDGYSAAYAINNLGLVAGFSAAANGEEHAITYLNGKMTDLGTLAGGLYSYADGLNDSGKVVGYAYTADGYSHAFVYANGMMVDLGTMGALESYAFDVNNEGDVVGGTETYNPFGRSNYTAFLYSGGKMVDLNSLIDPASGWDLEWANDINDQGQISARACSIGSGNCQDVLLTLADLGGGDPTTSVPEPEAFTAGIAGLALFGLLRRRKAAR